MSKSIPQGNLRDLPRPVINKIVNSLGGMTVLLTSKENIVLRTQNGSIRNLIVEKVAELQAKHGPVLTDKGNIVSPAREEYIEWYLSQRADAIAKNPGKDFKRWAIIHLQDSLKYRAELVKSLNIELTASEPMKELAAASA